MEISLEKVLKKIQWILNSNNSMLYRHTDKVAYIYMKLLEAYNYSQEEIITLVTIAILHDIGAYKILSGNEKLVNLYRFDVENPHEHSVYGYLFIRNFGPLQLQKYANVVLYHHFKYKDFDKLDKEYMKESQLLHLADRMSILIDKEENIDFDKLEELKGTFFDPEYVDLFIELEKKEHIADNILTGKYYEKVYELLGRAIINNKYLDDILNMIVCIIDLKSKYTMYHNITVTSIAREIAILSGMDFETVKEIQKAARIHDIGKVLIPVSILEKDGKLTKEEYIIMKEHITKGRKILEGICDKSKIKLATTHHEKLDGSGYPDGLTSDYITREERVLIIADIVSALMGKRSYKDEFDKETIISILQEEVENNKIDKETVDIFVNNYDTITERVKKDCKIAIEKYNIHRMEYEAITEHMKKYNFM